MTVISVFIGPSRPDDIERYIYSNEIDICPPASFGSITRAVNNGAQAIVLIDGYFEWQRAPWHKEIISAINKQVVVVGASSIGALRVAELFHFGMHPHGEIARRFVEGRFSLVEDNLDSEVTDRGCNYLDGSGQNVFTDDDDVMVVHAPEELQYQPYTIAMVNIVLSLERLRLDGQLKRKMLSIAKSLHYKIRTEHELKQQLEVCLAGRTDRINTHQLISDMFNGYRDFKKSDASNLLSMLERDGLNSLPKPMIVNRFSGESWYDYELESI